MTGAPIRSERSLHAGRLFSTPTVKYHDCILLHTVEIESKLEFGVAYSSLDQGLTIPISRLKHTAGVELH